MKSPCEELEKSESETFLHGVSTEVSQESVIAVVCLQDRSAYVSVMWAAGV